MYLVMVMRIYRIEDAWYITGIETGDRERRHAIVQKQENIGREPTNQLQHLLDREDPPGDLNLHTRSVTAGDHVVSQLTKFLC